VIRDDGSLLVCNAHKTDSRLSVFSACAADGSRSYVSDFATTHLAHPYGLAIGLDAAKGDEVVWASNQNTCDVVQFSGKSGVFQSQVGQLGTDEIRSIAYDNVTAVLYVADKDQNAVLAYNTKTATWGQLLLLPSYCGSGAACTVWGGVLAVRSCCC
jgi:DNA-binding beta-propeller fold protein YncE